MSSTIPEMDPLAIRQGDTLQFNVQCFRVDQDYEFILDANGNKIPKSIVGVTAQYAIARKIGDTPVISKSSPASGIVLTDPENGVMQITVPKEDTSSLLGTYWHEVQVIDGDGNRTTVGQGRITFRPQLIVP